jgi:hypothetical protein
MTSLPRVATRGPLPPPPQAAAQLVAIAAGPPPSSAPFHPLSLHPSFLLLLISCSSDLDLVYCLVAILGHDGACSLWRTGRRGLQSDGAMVARGTLWRGCCGGLPC